MSLYPFQSDRSRNDGGIDLRLEIDMIFERHGHWGLIRKRVRDRKCPCFNQQTHEARSDCQKCIGTGEAYLDHLVRYRKTGFVQMTESPREVGRAGGGTLVKIYLRSSVKPDRGDFFIEIAQDESSRDRNFQIQPLAPIEIVKVYDIQDVLDLREAGGRLEFFTVLAEDADLGDTT